MDYIYAKLNEKLAEQQSSEYIPTNIESSPTIDVTKFEDNDFILNVNTKNLVRLQTVQSDLNTQDDVIQRVRLLAYNSTTGEFDIPLGDDIIINHNTDIGGNLQSITHAVIAGQQIPASIDNQGQLVLQYIPSIAISDKIRVEDEEGNVSYQQIESIIDCND